MKTITIREAREGLSHPEQLFATDDEVIVTRRGEPVARILPIKPAKPKFRSLMIYADTSALVKRYLDEPFSAEFDALLQQNAMAISRLSVVELRCALARRRRNREIDPLRESRINAELAADIQDGTLRVGSIDDENFTTAYHLIGRLAELPLRTLDALHLAAAEQLAVTAFATADKTQAEAAAALGFTVHRFY